MEMDNRNEKRIESDCYDYVIGGIAKLKQNQLNFILGQPGVGRNLLTKAFLMKTKITNQSKIIVYDEDNELDLSKNLYDSYSGKESVETFMRNMLDDIYSQMRFQNLGVEPIKIVYFINAQPDEKWISKITKLTHNQDFSKLKTCIIWSSYLDKESEWIKSMKEINKIILIKGKNGVELNGIPIKISEKNNVVSVSYGNTNKVPGFDILESEFNKLPLIKRNTEMGNLLEDFIRVRNSHSLACDLFDTIEEDFMKYYKWFMEEI